MKKKFDIAPPSKNVNGSITEEQKWAELHEKSRILREKANHISEQVDAEEKYEITITNASKNLKIDRSQLEATFSSQKGALVKAFESTTSPSVSLGLSKSYAIFAPVFICLGALVDIPGLVVGGAINVGIASVLLLASYPTIKKKHDARQSIREQVTQHQKQLSDMTAPKVG